MTDGVSLKLTPDSKRILAMWAKDKSGKIDRIIDSWLLRMQAWMLRETMKAFDDGKQPGGSPWAPNTGLYAAWKASQGKTKPGILSGDLRRSFAQSKKIDKSGKKASIGSTLPYAPYLYYGSDTSPPRPYFPTVKRGEDYAKILFNQLVKKGFA